MKSFLIGAAASNSGKTTLTMGILRALTNKGLTVQPYKCGPDYIDTIFHCMASGRESVNLDTFMASHTHVREMFARYAKNADVSVVEGVMGLYDGYDKWRGSSAEIAALLGIPVILIVNAKSAAYSIAPLVYGFTNFTPKGFLQPLNIAGVIFNQVGSEKHYEFLKSACEDVGVRCFGYLKKNAELTVPGRHLGLTISERDNMERLISLAAEEVEKTIDLDALIKE